MSPIRTALLLAVCWRLDAAGAAVDYLAQVKPVLSESCYRCHGASQQKGGLRLDTAASALKGGDTGPAFKSGAGAESLLIRTVKGMHEEISRMPYKKPPLDPAQIALLERWIQEGAEAPADEQPETARHWSFIPPVRPAVPAIGHPERARNPVDHFVLERQEQAGIAPSAAADRITLIRRISLDLTGLPPTIAEVDDFVNDRRPDSYERLVERLLDSPHYGERWGRWWLDAARYADSNGYSIDAPRQIWKYRDWVVRALNRDMPFDQFAVEQLAGDLLPGATLDQKIATGLHRNTQINQEGGIDPEQFRVESVMDRVNTTGTAFLGLTVACAQCHDHKFDPMTQEEYYRLFAFFNSTVEDGHGKPAPGAVLEIPGEFEPRENLRRELAESEEDLDRFLNTQGAAQQKWEASLTPEERDGLKPEVREALNTPFAGRTLQQKRSVYAAFKPADPEFKQRQTRLGRLEKREPRPVTTLVMSELEEPRPTHLLVKGDFTRPGAPVTPGVPASLHPLKPSGTNRPTRLDLARWIADPENPLTARVVVNRIWLQYFGRGLVETENDFGTQGSPPSHPTLLDWLATELTGHGWSLKHIHRLIVTSATYRQSSRARPDLATVDPNNRLLARQNRLRLEAESVRDACLTASGLLNRQLGGPAVFPPQPDGVMSLGQVKREWKPSGNPDRYRRGLYTHFWRATPHPSLMVFDAPDAFSACTRRVRSNTPLQSLTLLNDQAFFEFAQGLAARVVGQATAAERMEYAFRLCLSRRPGPEEKRRLDELLQQELQALSRAPGEAEGIAPPARPPGAGVTELAAWTSVARVLLNLDETITRE